jgi:hypothetical protein
VWKQKRNMKRRCWILHFNNLNHGWIGESCDWRSGDSDEKVGLREEGYGGDV